VDWEAEFGLFIIVGTTRRSSFWSEGTEHVMGKEEEL
jgi:hypothetical protein